MLTAIISVAIGGLLFLCAWMGFKSGLRLGMTTAKGIVPAPVKTPVEAVEDWLESKEDKKANKAFQEGFNAVLNYDGNIPKEE